MAAAGESCTFPPHHFKGFAFGLVICQWRPTLRNSACMYFLLVYVKAKQRTTIKKGKNLIEDETGNIF